MKPFFVFAYFQYYPEGGMNDYHSSYETEAEALEAAQSLKAQGTYEHVDYEDMRFYLGIPKE